jgi:putative ABC transport system permease protein
VNGREVLRIALAGVAANKLRSGLTILGMTIGVSAVIILVAVGNGSRNEVASRINALGSNVLLVQAGFGSDVQLTQRDADALADEFNAPDVLRVSPVVNAGGTTFVNGQESYEPSAVVGTVPAYAQTRSYELQSGAMFTAEDVTRHRRVVVLGPTVAQSL